LVPEDESWRDRSEVLPVGLEALGEQVAVAHGHILWFAVVILQTDQESRRAGPE